jgi:hypothetical protein
MGQVSVLKSLNDSLSFVCHIPVFQKWRLDPFIFKKKSMFYGYFTPIFRRISFPKNSYSLPNNFCFRFRIIFVFISEDLLVLFSFPNKLYFITLLHGASSVCQVIPAAPCSPWGGGNTCTCRI